MNNHLWSNVVESEISLRDSLRPLFSVIKKQILWECGRCGTQTILDKGQNPEHARELYKTEPQELDGTIIMDPLVMSCDEEIIKKIMAS